MDQQIWLTGEHVPRASESVTAEHLVVVCPFQVVVRRVNLLVGHAQVEPDRHQKLENCESLQHQCQRPIFPTQRDQQRGGRTLHSGADIFERLFILVHKLQQSDIHCKLSHGRIQPFGVLQEPQRAVLSVINLPQHFHRQLLKTHAVASDEQIRKLVNFQQVFQIPVIQWFQLRQCVDSLDLFNSLLMLRNLLSVLHLQHHHVVQFLHLSFPLILQLLLLKLIKLLFLVKLLL